MPQRPLPTRRRCHHRAATPTPSALVGARQGTDAQPPRVPWAALGVGVGVGVHHPLLSLLTGLPSLSRSATRSVTQLPSRDRQANRPQPPCRAKRRRESS